MSLIYVTGNQRKIAEAKTILTDGFGIDFTPQTLAIDEIQHTKPEEVTKAKARSAYQQLKQPLIVNDSSFDIPALGGFPGAYVKDVSLWFSTQDWLNLMRDKTDKTVYIHDTIVYIDEHGEQVFSHTIPCHFVDTPRGESRMSITQVVALDDDEGEKTIAEVDEIVAKRQSAYEHLRQFARWYTKSA